MLKTKSCLKRQQQSKLAKADVRGNNVSEVTEESLKYFYGETIC